MTFWVLSPEAWRLYVLVDMCLTEGKWISDNRHFQASCHFTTIVSVYIIYTGNSPFSHNIILHYVCDSSIEFLFFYFVEFTNHYILDCNKCEMYLQYCNRSIHEEHCTVMMNGLSTYWLILSLFQLPALLVQIFLNAIEHWHDNGHKHKLYPHWELWHLMLLCVILISVIVSYYWQCVTN